MVISVIIMARPTLTLLTLLTRAATMSVPPDEPLWTKTVPTPMPQRMAPSTRLIVTSVMMGGWEVK